MSRNKRGKAKYPQHTGTQTSPGASVSIAEATNKSPEIGLEAEILVGEEVYAKIPAPTNVAIVPLQPSRIVDAYVAATKAKAAYELAAKDLAVDRESLHSDQQVLHDEQIKLQPRTEEVARREQDVAEREHAIAAKEVEARNGFANLLAQERSSWDEWKVAETKGIREKDWTGSRGWTG